MPPPLSVACGSHVIVNYRTIITVCSVLHLLRCSFSSSARCMSDLSSSALSLAAACTPDEAADDVHWNTSLTLQAFAWAVNDDAMRRTGARHQPGRAAVSQIIDA